MLKLAPPLKVHEIYDDVTVLDVGEGFVCFPQYPPWSFIFYRVRVTQMNVVFVAAATAAAAAVRRGSCPFSTLEAISHKKQCVSAAAFNQRTQSGYASCCSSREHLHRNPAHRFYPPPPSSNSISM